MNAVARRQSVRASGFGDKGGATEPRGGQPLLHGCDRENKVREVRERVSRQKHARGAEELVRLDRALAAVDAPFGPARAHRATVEFATEEIARLLSTISALHRAASALRRFEAPPQQLGADHSP